MVTVKDGNKASAFASACGVRIEADIDLRRDFANTSNIIAIDGEIQFVRAEEGAAISRERQFVWDSAMQLVSDESLSEGVASAIYIYLKVTGSTVVVRFGVDRNVARKSEILVAVYESLNSSELQLTTLECERIVLSVGLLTDRYLLRRSSHAAVGGNSTFTDNDLQTFLYALQPAILPWVAEIAAEVGALNGGFDAARKQHIGLFRSYGKAVLHLAMGAVAPEIKEFNSPAVLAHELEQQLQQQPTAPDAIRACHAIIAQCLTIVHDNSLAQQSFELELGFVEELKSLLTVNNSRVSLILVETERRLRNSSNTSADCAFALEEVCILCRESWLTAFLITQSTLREVNAELVGQYLQLQEAAFRLTEAVAGMMDDTNELHKTLGRFAKSQNRRWQSMQQLMGDTWGGFVQMLEEDWPIKFGADSSRYKPVTTYP